MNLLILVSDTLRWDYLGAYGNDWIKTPNLDRLAAQSAIYEDAYAEGLPTIPARRVIQTGRPIFPFRYIPQKSDMVQLHGWHPLFDEDITLAEHLRQHDYVSAFVTDVYHMMKPGKNFHRGFDHWNWIRGQEADPYALPDKRRVADLLKLAAPQAEQEFRDRHWLIHHLVHRKDWEGDEDTSVARVMSHAARWIRSYTMDEPFYMWVDCFDPHEPWDPPIEYARLYDPDYSGLDGLVPPPVTHDMTRQQVRNVLTAYAAEVTMTDRWIGRLLDTLEETGRLDDTLIVFTTDHGCMMGEQGELHKGENRLRNQCTRLPLFIRHPAGIAAGTRVRGFVQHTDMAPTALRIMGLPVPERMLGADIWPMAAQGAPAPRDAAVTAFGHYASLRTAQWNYVAPWTELPAGKPQREDLYDLASDPEELHNVAADNPEVVREMRDRLEEHIRSHEPLTTGSLGGTNQDVLREMGVKMSFDALPTLRQE